MCKLGVQRRVLEASGDLAERRRVRRKGREGRYAEKGRERLCELKRERRRDDEMYRG